MSIDGEERRVIHYLSITLSFYQVTMGELWLGYSGLGGEMRSYEVDEWLRGLRSLPVFECILLRMALDDVRDGPATVHSAARLRFIESLAPDPMPLTGGFWA